MSQRLIAGAVAQAREVMQACSTPAGLRASKGPGGHREIWARDSMIALLGAMATGDNSAEATLRATLAGLRANMSSLGAVPSLVDGTRVSHRSYADAGLWFIVGSTLVDPSIPEIARTLTWYQSQDVDASGLLSLQEAADWQDMLCVRGKGLYLNCLHVWALRRAAAAAQAAGAGSLAAEWTARYESAAERVNALFWYDGDRNVVRHLMHSFTTPDPKQDSLGRPRRIPPKRLLIDERYYLPYVAFRCIGEWFDSFGNLLAILSGVACESRATLILDFIARNRLDAAPLPAIYPPIQTGERDWRDYYAGLNEPRCYHNGGIWPFLGGFYVAALVKCGRRQAAAEALERLADLNLRGGFNEWHHGETLEPHGVAGQAWSAGMFLYAVACVNAGRALFFDEVASGTSAL